MYRLLDINILEDMVASLSCAECFDNNLHLEEDAIKKKSLVGYMKGGYIDESHISKKIMDGLCFTYLWLGLCSTRKVILHYE